MRHKLLVLVVALLMASMMGTAAGPAWGHNQVACDGSNEGDHGRDCLPIAKEGDEEEECKEGVWQAFTVFEYLFENVDVCN